MKRRLDRDQPLIFRSLACLAAWGAPGLAMILSAAVANSAGLPPIPSESHPKDEAIPPSPYWQQVEEDWIRQAKAIEERAAGAKTTQTDARGACDGVKNGKYGFHTGHEPNPWWQVDLGEAVPVSRLIVFNRLDYAPGLHNADRLRVLTSLDGDQWTEQYRHDGTPFGGVGGAKPLRIGFTNAPLARFVRLQIPSEQPVFFHLDEVEVFGPDAEGSNLALHRPADQSSASQWSTAKPLGRNRDPRRYPVAEFIASGRNLAEHLQSTGADCARPLRRLARLEARLVSLGKDASAEEQKALYLAVRRRVRELAFMNPLLDFDQLLFAKRFTQETYPDVCLNHMPWVSRPGGDICILTSGKGNVFRALATRNQRRDADPPDAEPAAATVRQVLHRALGPGHVHGLDLSWDGQRVVFGFARAQGDTPPEGWLDRSQSYRLRRTVEPIHIFEIGVDGRNLRQLTFGGWSDLDPTYAANGDIVFVSERCGTSLQCNEYDKDETSCNLYVMKPDGSGVRRLSVNKDGDYLPHSLDDGSIAYTRWEYHERGWAYIQSIWTIRPDGTGADALFKQHFVNPWALEDTRSIPGSSKLVAIAAGHHTLAIGPLVVIDPSGGINDPAGISIVTPDVKPPEGGMDGVPVKEGGVQDAGGFYATPWALSDKHFLVSYNYASEQTNHNGYALYLVDVFGNKDLIYRDPAISSFDPIPRRARKTPPVMAGLVDLQQDSAACIVTEASFGSDGIEPAQVRFIRVAEPIGWPYELERGGKRYGEDHAYGGPDADRKNLLNWTPVRILGDVPVEPDGSAHFRVPADKAVYFQLLDENRMELRRMRSFISFQPGEVRACVGCHESRVAAPLSQRTAQAALREPSAFLPAPWGDRPVSFLRDIQPVLDRHCVRCHRGLEPAGGLEFSSGLTSHNPAVAGYGYNRAYETIMAHGLVSISKAREQDASITPPLAYGSRKSKLVQALDKQPNVSADDRLRVVMWIDANAPYHDGFVDKRPSEPAYDLAADESLQTQIAAVHSLRCAFCHDSESVSRLDWIDLRAPERSLFLAAPLGSHPQARCPGGAYPSAADPDYDALSQLVSEAVSKAWQNPRRDLQTLGPGSK